MNGCRATYELRKNLSVKQEQNNRDQHTLKYIKENLSLYQRLQVLEERAQPLKDHDTKNTTLVEKSLAPNLLCLHAIDKLGDVVLHQPCKQKIDKGKD